MIEAEVLISSTGTPMSVPIRSANKIMKKAGFDSNVNIILKKLKEKDKKNCDCPFYHFMFCYNF